MILGLVRAVGRGGRGTERGGEGRGVYWRMLYLNPLHVDYHPIHPGKKEDIYEDAAEV